MGRIRVSDHAILTWLETVEGVNVEGIRRRIRKAVIGGSKHGATGVRLDGVTFNLQHDDDGGSLVTTTRSRHPRRHLAEARLDVVEAEG